MANHIFAGELSCPMCRNGSLSATYIPDCVRYYTFDSEEVHDHFGESCDVECKNCGFQFNYHLGQAG